MRGYVIGLVRYCARDCEVLDPNMLQVYFRQASSRTQESLNLSQLPSPDEGLVLQMDDDLIC